MTTWIVSLDSTVSHLLALADSVGEDTIVVTSSPTVRVGRRTLLLDTPACDVASAPQLAAVVDARPGDRILARNAPTERAVAALVAARLGVTVHKDPVAFENSSVRVSRFGGLSEEVWSGSDVVVAVAEGGESVTADTAVETVEASVSPYSVTVVSEQSVDAHEAKLASARTVVAAGRGFACEEDLQLARDLAEALHAELACSRPLVEGAGWMAHDRYIGVSGAHVSPKLYVALGISGQLQHMAGVHHAETIVAVNSDPDAPIFGYADYGIVGDLYEVVPALTALLRG